MLTIFWFRNDLRLADNRALRQAIVGSSHILPVYCHNPDGDETNAWGFPRTGPHRRCFLRTALDDLRSHLQSLGSDLLELSAPPTQALIDITRSLGATRIVTEAIEAPEELDLVATLRADGIPVETVWQSSLLDPGELPFALRSLPDIFTAFRHAVEQSDVLPPAPVDGPAMIPPLPSMTFPPIPVQLNAGHPDERSSFPYDQPAFFGGESAAVAHLHQYFTRKLAHTYKTTRNGTHGVDYSSKFSPWLTNGALSARQIYVALKQFETTFGANESTYWLWFELLWRDYFRMLHFKYGKRLYRAAGLSTMSTPAHNPVAFKRWCQGQTGEPFIDAGMRDLAATGYLSNRLRQNVASFLVHDLQCDWRAGAAWFEAMLLDYDVYSNQGNWLYVSGRGTDPRTGRRFNPQKQARDYDAKGAYRALWAT